MVATAPLKKSPSMKECVAQADPSKEASTIKRNECSLATPLFK